MELPAETRGCIEANNNFAVSIFLSKHEQAPDKDMFISMYGVFSTLGSLANADTTDTQKSILEYLDYPDITTLNLFLSSLNRQLPALDPTSVFEIANSFWTLPQMAVSTKFTEAVKTVTNPYIGKTEMDGMPSPDLERWLEQHAPGYGLEPFQIRDHMWINTAHFKAKWGSPFDKSGTQLHKFTQYDGTVGRVSMMHQDAAMQYGECEGWQSVTLELGNGAFAFTAMLPPESKSTGDLTVDVIEECLGNEQTSEVSLKLPRLSVQDKTIWDTPDKTSRHGDSPVLPYPASRGFDSMFSDTFGGKEGLMKSWSSLEMDEEGMEVKSETIAGNEVTSPGPGLSLVFDRPFVFFIREKSSGTILFMGQKACADE